ncbi:MAG: hypothetical protein ACLT8A_14700, partial [Subdoligranulum sp.]
GYVLLRLCDSIVTVTPAPQLRLLSWTAIQHRPTAKRWTCGTVPAVVGGDEEKATYGVVLGQEHSPLSNGTASKP